MTAFLVFYTFSGSQLPHARPKQYHISFNCLALSSEARREEREWKNALLHIAEK